MTTLVFRNGTIGRTGARALSVHNGRISAIGQEAERAAANADDVVDLAGGMLMPSMGDGHAHPVTAGLGSRFADLHGARTVDEIQRRVARWVAENPDRDWVRGDGYDPTIAPGGVFRAEWLDAVCADRPVWLRATDLHTAWVNSAALTAAGIARDTPEPPDGEIVRDADGTPIGTLREWGAWGLIAAVAPPITSEMGLQAVESATRTLANAGITWVQDAWVEDAELRAWLAAAEAGVMRTRANLAFLQSPGAWRETLEFACDGRSDLRRRVPGLITGRTVKFFADGVIEAGTAALSHPYEGHADHHGLPNWDAAELLEAATAADARGLQLHIHAMGDAAVRTALDIVERISQTNGPRDRRPVIAHAQLVDPADLPRFAALGVIANFQPLWARADELMTELTEPRLGEQRSRWQYPIATLARTARIAFGSDWPVTTYDPWSGIRGAVTRLTPYQTGDGWIPEERLSLDEALSAYTRGVAYQAFEESEWGRLEPGCRADLITLLDDPHEHPAEQLDEIRPTGTWLNGMPVA